MTNSLGDNIFTPTDQSIYDKDHIGMVGVFLNAEINNTIAQSIAQGAKNQPINSGTVAVNAQGVGVLNIEARKSAKTISDSTLAIIYAYVFEGNCYRLDCPQIITVTGMPAHFDDPAISDATGAQKSLYIWTMNRHQRIASVYVEDGFIEDLILNANLPGNRNNPAHTSKMQVGSYSSKMQAGGSYNSKMQGGRSFASKMQGGAHHHD